MTIKMFSFGGGEVCCGCVGVGGGGGGDDGCVVVADMTTFQHFNSIFVLFNHVVKL